jgi:hypothetical protein
MAEGGRKNAERRQAEPAPIVKTGRRKWLISRICGWKLTANELESTRMGWAALCRLMPLQKKLMVLERPSGSKINASG